MKPDKADEFPFEDSSVTYKLRNRRRAVSRPSFEIVCKRVCDSVGVPFYTKRDYQECVLADHKDFFLDEYDDSFRRKKLRFLLFSVLTDSRLRIVGAGKQVHESWSNLASRIELMQLVVDADSRIDANTAGCNREPSPLTRLVDTLNRYVSYVNAEYSLREICAELELDFVNITLPDVRESILNQARDRQSVKKLFICYDGLSKVDAERVSRIKKFAQRAWAEEETARESNKSHSSSRIHNVPAYTDMREVDKDSCKYY